MDVAAHLKLTRFLSTSSGTFLVELQSALAALWEKITGALVVCRAALIVLVETWERSTSIPSLFSSLTTAWKIIKNNIPYFLPPLSPPIHFKLRQHLPSERKYTDFHVAKYLISSYPKKILNVDTFLLFKSWIRRINNSTKRNTDNNSISRLKKTNKLFLVFVINIQKKIKDV